VHDMMLEVDRELFSSKYPDAAAFMLAASLRHECYVIGRRRPSERTNYHRGRLEELLRSPACREPWFVRKFESECFAEADAVEGGV
jgi:hypothetical protein